MNNNVAAYRTMFKIKQSELAEMLQMGVSTLSLKENGKANWSSDEMVNIYEIFKEKKKNLKFEDVFFV